MNKSPRTKVKQLSRVVLALTAATVNVSAQTASDEADGTVYELEALVVSGAEFDAFKSAIVQQRDASNIKTVVDAGAFGDVTEGNVGEFLKHLPGVTVNYTAADARSVSIRGLAPEFTPVTVDGNRMASASSSESTRAFEFEQVSMNNVGQIEVTKVPTPNMEADSLGGSVNMVSRNAFDRTERQITYRAYLNVPEDHINWNKTPGPGNESTRKIKPGFDFSYSDPITDNFGIIINYLNSETYTPQGRLTYGWEYPGTNDPYLRQVAWRDGQKLSTRESFGVKADWRIAPHSILSAGFQWNDYATYFYNRDALWNLGGNIAEYGPTFTRATGLSGRLEHSVESRIKTGETIHTDIGMKHDFNGWKIDYDAYYSKSKNYYKDQEGGVGRARLRTRNSPSDNLLRIDYENIRPGAVDVTTYDSAGNIVENPFEITSRAVAHDGYVFQFRPSEAIDEIHGGKFNISREIDIAGKPVTLRAGMLYRNQERDISREQNQYTVVGGAGNYPGSLYLDTHYSGIEIPASGYVADWPSLYTMYEHFIANPANYELQHSEDSGIPYREQNKSRVEEEVTAGYLMGSVNLMNNRLKLLAGVRYERTKTLGDGYHYDPYFIYERDANGNLLAGPGHESTEQEVLADDVRGRLYRLPKPKYAVAALKESPLTAADRMVIAEGAYVDHGLRTIVHNSYDDFYPSIHATYLVTDQFQIRLAYARSMGRPDLNYLSPGILYGGQVDPDDSIDASLDPDASTIAVSDRKLTAYTADNFDISLEYYFQTGGVVSVGVFYKEISGWIANDYIELTTEFAEEYGILPFYIEQGYIVDFTTNVGDVTIKGIEASVMQELFFLPDYLKGFSVYANATALSTDGNYGEKSAGDYVAGFVKQNINWGITYDRGPVDIRLKWNWRGKEMTETTVSSGVRYYEFRDEQLTTDLNIEYKFSDHLRLFLNGRNIFSEPADHLRKTIGGWDKAPTPSYAALRYRNYYGALWSVGLKGTF